MKFLSTATVILSLSKSTNANVFGNSTFDEEKNRLIGIYESLLDVNIPFWTVTPFILLDRMYEDGILENYGESALARLLGYSPIIDKKECRDDSFGMDGTYTDVICDAHDTLKAICEYNETGCDVNKIPHVASASSDDFLQEFTVDSDGDKIGEGASDSLTTKRNLMKTAVCIFRVAANFGDPFNSVEDCRDLNNLPDEADLGNRVSNYYAAMIYILSSDLY